jgi:hypothetical protein
LARIKGLKLQVSGARSICVMCTKMSETPTTDISDDLVHQRMIRSLELKLERLEHGLAMPRDEDAIARTKALLEEVRDQMR